MRSLKILSLASRAMVLGFFTLFSAVQAQNSVTNLASEYPLVGLLPGDQVHSSVSFDSNGGWIVWHDNVIDGDGMGIAARHLNSTLSGDLNVFRVNEIGAGEQENPQVKMLKDGGAVFVWQGGRIGFQQIYARFISSGMTFQSGDILVNTYTNQQQINPTVAELSNGKIIIVWQSYGQDGSLFGVYGRIFSTDGSAISSEFRVNESVLLNQRDPQVAVLTNGNFIVNWISERSGSVADTNNPISQFAVEVWGRLFTENGNPIGNEFLISSDALCANPFVAAGPDGGFIAAWSQNVTGNISNRWDVFGRAFTSSGIALGEPNCINQTLIGDQAGPSVAVTGTNVFVVWTSMGQDGSEEGVYGRSVSSLGSPIGTEMRINTTTQSKQVHPTVASDDAGRFLVVWSSFKNLSTYLDLSAQRFVVGAHSGGIPPSSPHVFALNSTSLSVTWPEMAGYPVAFYEVYVDNSATPTIVYGIQVVFTNLAVNSTHTFKLLYVLTDGQRSPLSPVAVGTTWGIDNNGDNLPDDWQTSQWGANPSNWPLADVDSDGDGASNLMEFLAGTNPNDAASVLRAFLRRTQSGFEFSWNTQPGMVYQLQSAMILDNWQDVGSPRFAHGTADTVAFAAGSQSSFYRVIRLR